MDFIEKIKGFFFRLRLFAVEGCHAAFCASLAFENCACCGKRTVRMPVCKGCAEKFLLSFVPPGSGRCLLCGKILLSGKGLCSSCREKRVLWHADSVFPLWQYRLWFKGLLFEWKMNANRSLSPLFALCVDMAIDFLFPGRPRGSVVLVPVPPRPGKIREKGWDQIDDLCKILHFCYGRSVCRLIRRLSSVQQKKQDREHRLLLGASSYKADGKAVKRLAKSASLPQEAVLLDDVMTTGATVDACSAVLKGEGIRKVQVITLLIVD
ncbi:MAG: ComF family protein [Treponema sp.]|nr:ComF family protein [Treponema sp.]MBR4385104.1 ComF family protein [Treponema sp.]